MYAIVRTGGKQYKVAPRTVITVEKLEVEDGSTIVLTDVLLVSDGENLKIGAPTVDGATVTARVLSTKKGRKIHGYTYKPTKRIQRHYGHRQWGTMLLVEAISG